MGKAVKRPERQLHYLRGVPTGTADITELSVTLPYTPATYAFTFQQRTEMIKARDPNIKSLEDSDHAIFRRYLTEKTLCFHWEHQTVNTLQEKNSFFVRILHTNKYRSAVSAESRIFSVQPSSVLQMVNGKIFL
jgi:hypothetical protein